MTDAYIMRITKKMQIPEVVIETGKRACNGPLFVLLEHYEEPNVVRGRRQPLEKVGMNEIKRPDSGRSWYHPKTRCFMFGGSFEDTRNPQGNWAETIMSHLSANGYDNKKLKYEDGDIFYFNGSKKHLMGTSRWKPEQSGKKVHVLRACWYETDPIKDISELLKADNIDPGEFKQCQQLVRKGFFRSLVNELNPERIKPIDFVSYESMLSAYDLQREREGDVRGSCVMGR